MTLVTNQPAGVIEPAVRRVVEEVDPRLTILTVRTMEEQVALSFNPETFFCSAVKLPDVEDADSPRVVFEERISMLRDLSRALDSLFHAFLNTRASSGWESKTGVIRRWITQPAKQLELVGQQ
jgi:hypothetical protein